MTNPDFPDNGTDTPCTPEAPDHAPATREPSGAAWVHRIPGSRATQDLAPSFRTAVEAFLAAMAAATIRVRIAATLRSRERAYLMHWSWKIARGKVEPEDVPPMTGVPIDWVHPAPKDSIRAAQAMVAAFGMSGLRAAPSLDSLHQDGRAIDMTISWRGVATIRDAAGKEVVLDRLPRTGMNPQLIGVGATYGVIKSVGGSNDKLHWSATGRKTRG
ncbi:hypothetical protein [Pseudoduganella buxea]|uniref:Peptidoglycan-binding domain-containing protein n=1 Tax=Pseudoduganella buxea TaxID=1949069 RepID=A0ABQ1KS61_9BURK|nr:hypothetical protein [Pseudoduganella buxea]GGC05481.1 hypothetical protein GCM10011572_29220 [Pseudoduganella buxea]